MEIFDPFRDVMPHRAPGVSRFTVCIGGPAGEAGSPRYQSRVFVCVRSYEKVMRVPTFISLGAPQGMKIPFPW